MKEGQFYAHSSNRAGSPWEPLAEHLSLVAERAGRYAAPFGAAEEASAAGLLHDIGKYSDVFTRRLKNEVSGLDHWSGGALAALEHYKAQGLAVALAIQGHHIGLQQGSRPGIQASADIHKLSNPNTHPLALKLTESNIGKLLERLQQDGLALGVPSFASSYDLTAKATETMLDARMIFSSLVDADFIETEAHFQGKDDGTKVYRQEGPLLNASQAIALVMNHLWQLRDSTGASEDVRRMRG